MTDELTPERVRAALEMIDGQAAAWRRYEVNDTADACETLAALARAHLANAETHVDKATAWDAMVRSTERANAAAPPASPWRRITPEALVMASADARVVVGRHGRLPWQITGWMPGSIDYEPTHYIPLDEPPAEEAGR